MRDAGSDLADTVGRMEDASIDHWRGLRFDHGAGVDA
jgi:hypothetical protein